MAPQDAPDRRGASVQSADTVRRTNNTGAPLAQSERRRREAAFSFPTTTS